MIDRLEVYWRHFRRKLSRSEWAIRLLKLSKSEESPSARGLVMIQIDGLAEKQFLLALQRGNFPFIRRLIKSERYKLHSMYPGLPSSTPAVQGEIFYGVKTAVPAFSFIDRSTGEIEVMLDSRKVAARISELGEGLLKGGSAYSDIYAAGSVENRFCSSNFGFGNLLKDVSPFSRAFLLLTNLYSFVRTCVLLAVEFVLAIFDSFRGFISGQDFVKELKFIPTRVAICVLMREIITISAKIDVTRGLPIVHVNFLGYDEQAHRRGPTSTFAHWALKGIDDAISRIWKTARQSARRDYDIWIYSDHGQEEVIPFPEETGKTIQDAVAAVFNEVADRPLSHLEEHGIQTQRAELLGLRMLRKFFDAEGGGQDSGYGTRVVVTAMGPVGHIYAPQRIDRARRGELAAALVRDAGIPLVLIAEGLHRARAWTPRGEFTLPEQAAEILGSDHPYLDETAIDLVALVHHPDAGDFVISGWRTDKKSISFPVENGSHAGPGTQETRAFILAPPDAPLNPLGKPYLRPLDLRHGAMRFLKRPFDEPDEPPAVITRRPGGLRVMTYNVHSCRGMDGKLSPERIARIIAQNEPDIVALQELDVGRARTGSVDQAEAIAQALEMQFHFHPAIHMEEEKYGDAILTRHPMRLVRAAPLPTLNGRRKELEPRGALWVVVEIDGHEIQFINTHLGLRPKERTAQADALLSSDWLSHDACSGPVILCGDFNALPRSTVCKKLCGRLRDVQVGLDGHRPLSTWFGRAPLGRIDHVFTSEAIKILSVEVPKTELTRVASDHLPLIVELEIIGR